LVLPFFVRSAGCIAGAVPLFSDGGYVPPQAPMKAAKKIGEKECFQFISLTLSPKHMDNNQETWQ